MTNSAEQTTEMTDEEWEAKEDREWEEWEAKRRVRLAEAEAKEKLRRTKVIALRKKEEKEWEAELTGIELKARLRRLIDTQFEEWKASGVLEEKVLEMELESKLEAKFGVRNA